MKFKGNVREITMIRLAINRFIIFDENTKLFLSFFLSFSF